MTGDVHLGCFELLSGELVVSDPMFEDPSAPLRALEGTWDVWVRACEEDGWGRRNALLWCCHRDHPVKPTDPVWEIPFDGGEQPGVWVDSGQAGVFDGAHYRDESVVTEDIENPVTGKHRWYNLCCERSGGKESAGLIPYGCVSVSGLGDGSYPYHPVHRDGLVVALGLDFGLLDRPYAAPPPTPLQSAERSIDEGLKAGGLDPILHGLEILDRAGEPVALLDPDLLLRAAASGQREAVRAMLEAGADPGTEKHGVTLLGCAVRSGDPDLVELLVRAGARVVDAGSDFRGLTRRDHVHACWIADLLFEAGAPKEHRDSLGQSLHTLAARAGRAALADHLADLGCPVQEPPETTPGVPEPQAEPGITTGRVARGPFADLPARARLRDDGSTIYEVEVFGRWTVMSLQPDQFEPRD